MQRSPLQVVLGEAGDVGALVVVGVLLLHVDAEELREPHEVPPVALLLTVTRGSHLESMLIYQLNQFPLSFCLLGTDCQISHLTCKRECIFEHVYREFGIIFKTNCSNTSNSHAHLAHISWSSNAPCTVAMPSAKLKLFDGRREKAIEVVKCDLPSPPKACTK